MAITCQVLLSMMKHINPFARANGEGELWLNDCVKGDAQCEEDTICSWRREKTGRGVKTERQGAPSPFRMAVSLLHGGLFSHSSLASAPHAARLHPENER